MTRRPLARLPLARRRTAVTLAALLLAGALAACGEDEQDPGSPTVTAGSTPGVESSPSEPETSESSPGGGSPTVVETVVTGLAVPWGVDFLPDGAAIVTERDSRRVLVVRQGRAREIGVMEAAAPQGEAGLLGVAVSPDFAQDQTLFFYLTTADDNRVVRASFDGRRLGEPEVVLDGIPAGFIHDGGRLEFGPDGHLYVSTGEIGERSLAQDPDSLGGKILRITTDGDPAPGNPVPDSPVWSLGHRNVQGLAFDDDGDLWASEFGDSSFDELNLIEAGNNYGWPEVEGRGERGGLTDPQVVWSTGEASPSGLAHLDGKLYLAALMGERLWRVDVANGRASAPKDFFVGEYGRLRTVVVAPDGNLWVTTSNRDGRGDPAAQDDRILLVRP
ncbi:PQQ-dependent sugar dehydrogenase [Nocardioides pacificus]